jgi:putative hydrolase of the HAD superfamily
MLSRKKFFALIDADDTILGVRIGDTTYGTEEAYRLAKAKFCKLMQIWGYDEIEVQNTHMSIYKDVIKTYGFADRSQYPRSFRTTYEFLSNRYGNPMDSARGDEVESIGWDVFSHPYVALPGALDTLKEISKDYRIIIVTKGEEAEQQKKVFDSGCFIYADQTIVMRTKSLEEWTDRVMKPLRISTLVRKYSWAIGNSVKSDINPPLRLGFNGLAVSASQVYIEQEEVIAPMADRTFAHVTQISEVLSYLFPNGVSA